MPYEKQYLFAYETIKKEWSVHVLHNAIKAANEKKYGLKNQYLWFKIK